MFLVNVPVCAAVVVAGSRFLPEDEQRTSRHIDLLGVGTLSIALLLVVVPLTLGHGEGWPARA